MFQKCDIIRINVFILFTYNVRRIEMSNKKSLENVCINVYKINLSTRYTY